MTKLNDELYSLIKDYAANQILTMPSKKHHQAMGLNADGQAQTRQKYIPLFETVIPQGKWRSFPDRSASLRTLDIQILSRSCRSFSEPPRQPAQSDLVAQPIFGDTSQL
jgi:hypothetical protein